MLRTPPRTHLAYCGHVARRRARNIPTILALAIASGPLVPGTHAGDDPWVSSEVAAPLLRNHTGSRAPNSGNASATPGADAKSNSPSGWSRTTLALVGVLALIAFLAFVSRKLRFLPTARRPGMIQILSRTPLSGRQSLCLVRIGPRSVLLGITADRINALDVIDDPALTAALAGESLQNSSADSGGEFRARLDAQEGLYDQDEPGAHDDVEDDAVLPDNRMREVRRKLAGTLRRLGALRSA